MYAELRYYYKHKSDSKFLEKRRKYYRNWYKKNGRRRSVNYLEISKNWRVHHPLEVKAHRLLENALKEGDIIKADQCSECKRKNIRLSGHHEDYLKPLEVVWLCSSCHKLRHSVKV